MLGMILAAGFGTRLWPLTEQRPKPAIPFLGRPLLVYVVEYLAKYGVRELIVNLHHHPDAIREALGDGSRFGVSVDYSYEPEILGTSGALDPIRSRLAEDDFVVVNGKIVTDIDLGDAIKTHRERQALATLVLRQNIERERFTRVQVDGEGRIVRFGGVTGSASDQTPLMFTGIQVLSPRVLDYVPRGRFSHSTTDVYPSAIAAGEVVIAHIGTGEWHEMSTIERYLDATMIFLQKARERGSDTNFVTGEGCKIAGGAFVKDSILWDRVKVGPGARLRRVIATDDVEVPAGVVIEQAVIIRRAAVREIERGEVAGENLIIPIGAGS